jgi:hypothetical protein
MEVRPTLISNNWKRNHNANAFSSLAEYKLRLDCVNMIMKATLLIMLVRADDRFGNENGLQLL